MAVRRVILCIGDETVTGRPVSELTAIDPSYANAQTDFDVWNIQAQAWENLTPGTNSNTVVAASNLWSYESRLREGLRSRFPTEKLYLIKYAAAGSIRDWSQDGGALLTALVAEVTAAAAAASPTDTLSIDAICFSVQKEDHQLDTWRSYGHQFRDLLQTIRNTLNAIADVAVGTLRDDAGLTPFAVLGPHYDYDTSDDRLNHCRMQVEILENEDDRTRVVRSQGLLAESDGSYAANAAVSLGQKVADHLFAASYDDASNPEAAMVLGVGDSTMEGSFTVATSLPAHQQEALTGARIWRPEAGAFQTMQVGALGNNLISWPQIIGYYGIEIGLCDKIRDVHDVYYVKGSQISSRASDTRGRLDTGGLPPPPHGDINLVNWAPGEGKLSDLCIHGWFMSAVQALRDDNKKPVLKLCVISVGLNDTAYAASDSAGVRPSIESIIARVKKLCADHSVDTTNLRFVVLVPPTYAMEGVAPFNNAVQAKLDEVRADLLSMPDIHADVSVIDLSNHASTDNYHQNDAGTATLVDEIYAAYLQGAPDAVRPMFAPTMSHLRAALRLSQVPDTNDAVKMIESANQTAKSWFFRELGPDKIAALQAIPYTTNPISNNEHLRNVAVETEVKMMRSELLRTLPLIFKDGSSTVQVWNEEAAFREGGLLQTENEIKRLRNEINDGLEMLRKSAIVGAGGVSVEAVPGTDNDRPGDSTFKVI